MLRRLTMKALQKVSKFLSDYTSIVVIAIAVVTLERDIDTGKVDHPDGGSKDKSDAVCGSGIQQVHMSVNHYRNHHV